MDLWQSTLMYFGANAGATFMGIIYWLGVESLQATSSRRYEKLGWAIVLSLLFTPIGLWIIASVVKLRRTIPTLKT